MLLLRLAAENRRWGYGRLQGDLAKLGYPPGRSTVREVLKWRHVPPATPRSQRAGTWRLFLAQHRAAVLACYCFTVEALLLKTNYVLFFLEAGARRVRLTGCTAHPTASRIAQQARQPCWPIQDDTLQAHVLIRDRYAKFPPAFDTLIATEGVEVSRTPYRAPNANADARRRIRPARTEGLAYLLFVNEAHLRRILAVYVAYFNLARPQQSLEQRCPVASPSPLRDGPVRRRDRLCGLLHDYYREAP